MSNVNDYSGGVPNKSGVGDKTPKKSNNIKREDLGKGKTGHKLSENSENETFQINHVVYADDTESAGKVYIETKTGHDKGLYDKGGVAELQEEMNIRILKEISYSIATKNPYAMGAILAGRGILTFADARNQDKSIGASLAYTVIGNYGKPTTITYSPFNKIMHKVEHSGKVGKMFVESAEWVHKLQGKFDIKVPIGDNPANVIKINPYIINAFSRAEKEGTLATFYYAPKKLLFGDDSHNNSHDAQINKHVGDLGHGATNHANSSPGTHGDNNVVLPTTGLTLTTSVESGNIIDSTRPPVHIEVPVYANPHSEKVEQGNFWENKLLKASEVGGGEKVESKSKFNFWNSPISTTVAWLIEPIDDIIRDINVVNRAEDKLAAGIDENDDKRQRVAAVLNDIEQQGGSWTITNGNLTITPPPKKTENNNSLLNPGTITISQDNLRTTVKANSLMQMNVANTKKIKKTLDGAAAQKKVEDNLNVLKQNKQASMTLAAQEQAINNARAREGAIYGQKGEQGLGIGIRKTQFGQVNIYVQQMQQLRGTPAFGTPTIGPARGY